MAECTIKVIKKSILSLEVCEQIVNEIEILKELDHPNLMRIYDCYQDTINIYIVEERFQGSELFDVIINSDRLFQIEIAYIIHQVLQAVAYCHSNSITHRDIKPENILI